MKKCMAFVALILCMLLTVTALASVDTDYLTGMAGMRVYGADNQLDTVIRPENQPFEGKLETPGFDLYAYVDYVIKPEQDDTVFMRLTLSMVCDEPVNCAAFTLHVGGKAYTFQPERKVSEYDTIFYEDYSVCLTAASLPMLKAAAKSTKDTFSIEIMGEVDEYVGTLTLPGEEIAQLYDAYIRAGGNKQELDYYDELWPVEIR